MYSWISLFYSIPLSIIEPIIIALLYFKGGSITDSDNIYFTYLWNLIVAWTGLPFFVTLAILAEIILIPSFIIGLIIVIIYYIYLVILYIIFKDWTYD